MRILSVVTQLESGGAQTLAVELHREFLRRDIASSLAFLYEKDPAVFPKRDYDTYLSHRPRSPLDHARILARLRASWARLKPSAVIAHTHFTNNLCAIAKATGLGGALLAVHHNVYESVPASSRLLDRFGRALGLYAAEVSVAEPVLRSLPERGSSRPRPVILNGQSLARSSMGRDQARRDFGLPQDAFLVGNIGRLAEQKNQTFLVDLLALVPDMHAAILGEGDLRGALEAQAARLGVSDRLHLIGAVVHERVPDFFAALDLFAMPSLWEGMSVAMLEALASGLPFLGTDVPAIAEVVTGGPAGGCGLVLPLDLARWQDEIERLRRDPAARADLGVRARARADDFSIERMADRYIETARAAAAA